MVLLSVTPLEWLLDLQWEKLSERLLGSQSDWQSVRRLATLLALQLARRLGLR